MLPISPTDPSKLHTKSINNQEAERELLQSQNIISTSNLEGSYEISKVGDESSHANLQTHQMFDSSILLIENPKATKLMTIVLQLSDTSFKSEITTSEVFGINVEATPDKEGQNLSQNDH